MLKLDDIHTFYGKSQILNGVSLEIGESSGIALSGRNGVGKTTTMKTIMGIQPPKSGKVLFFGEDIAGLPPYRIARKGISLIPEDRRVIPNLTVYENLKLGSLVQGKVKDLDDRLQSVFGYFPRLKERLGQEGGKLSGGEQQMLTIARGLMAKPKLMLIDEPSEGLAPKIVQEIMEIIQKLQQDGVTILLVEQHAEMAMRLSDNLRAYVIEKGEVRMAGTLEELTCRIDDVVRCLGAKI